MALRNKCPKSEIYRPRVCYWHVKAERIIDRGAGANRLMESGVKTQIALGGDPIGKNRHLMSFCFEDPDDVIDFLRSGKRTVAPYCPMPD